MDEKNLAIQECLLRMEQGEELDSLLASFPQYAGELGPILASARWLSAQRPALDPPPEFLAASRRRLVESLQDSGAAPADQHRPLFGNVFARRPLAVGRLAIQLLLAFLLFATSFSLADGLLHASRTWLPGDPPYELKTVYESLELRLASSPARRAGLHIEFAQRRMLEAQALVFEGRYELLPETVASFSSHLEAAVREIRHSTTLMGSRRDALAAELEQSLRSQGDLFELLARAAPEPARRDLERLISISQDGLLQLHTLEEYNGG